jgi:subtilisin-like proprotein convertase family protein
VKGGQVSVTDGAEISSSTSGAGGGGTITVEADSIVLDGEGSRIIADTYLSLPTIADLAAILNIWHTWDYDLETKLISPLGTEVLLFSGVGGAGDNFINTRFEDRADTPIAGGSAPFTGSFRPAEPLAQLIGEPASGTWALEIRDRNWGDQGELQNWSLELGDEVFQSIDVPKNIIDRLTVTSTLPIDLGPHATVQAAEPKNHAGDINVITRSIDIQNGAKISATSSGTGRGGTVRITATEKVAISGQNSGLFTNAEGSGAGGNIELQAQHVQLTKGASVSGKSTGTGRGGTVQITATETFQSDDSSLTTGAEKAEGGDITIGSQDVQLYNGSVISAESSGAGDAGNIVITAKDTFLMRDSSVTTESEDASGGNIKINSDYMVRLGDSEITASVQGGPDTVGGDINIDPEYVILSKSNIIANAFEGKGGNISIVAGTFLADPNCIVDASSEKGIDGTVDIRAPIKDVSQSVSRLPEEYLSAAELLREACIARIHGGKYSSFVVKGRDGLPIEPGGLLPSPLYLE